MCPVKVYCRIRPIEENPCIEVVDSETIKIRGLRGTCVKETEHTFSRIFGPSSSQSTVFSEVAAPLIEEFLGGHNSLLFTYGVTGSGKTFTMRGTPDSPGLLARSLDSIFNSLENCLVPKYSVKSDGQNSFFAQSESDALVDKQRLDYEKGVVNRRLFAEKVPENRDYEATRFDIAKSFGYSVFVTYYEVYNNYIYDLMLETSDSIKPITPSKVLREDTQRNVYVAGLVEREIRSADEGLALFQQGQKNRHMASTMLNHDSSRSHCVFSIKLVRTNIDSHYREIDLSNPGLRVSVLSLVDLAGSERTNRAQTKGDRLKEASSINNSLMNLRKCIQALRANQLSPGRSSRQIVPFRDSKLTHLFKNFFEGDGSVRMVICLRPVMAQTDEILHVLKFAEASQEVSTVRSADLDTPKTSSSGYHSIPDVSSDFKQMHEEFHAYIRDLTMSDSGIQDRVRALLALAEVDFSEDSDVPDQQLMAACDLLDEIVKLCEDQFYQMERAVLTQDDCEQLFSSQVLRKAEQQMQGMSWTQDADLKRLQTENAQLQAQLQRVEEQLGEKSSQLQQERGERLKQAETHRVLMRQMRDRTKVAEPVAPWTVSKMVRKLETPARVAAPPFNPRHRRKSKSVGESWIEHTEKNATPLGTILTPKLSRKRSTSRPNLKETASATNYLLQHQEAGPDGSLETKYYKGNVIPTAGGGASVIFDDVETLTQTSPLKTRSGLSLGGNNRNSNIKRKPSVEREVQWGCKKHKRNSTVKDREDSDEFRQSISPPRLLR
ncbi:Kinesin-like protein kif23 [Cichlidogyrus casuarinus]|uniref:Kinesin-like protein n=1 Tax=Cichlidogyrus casuarinus TaxID=1844966 RepID=A0ABD2PYZ7_9PLAT